MYDYLKPLTIDFDFDEAKSLGIIGGNIAVHLPGFQPSHYEADIFIIGVNEDRNAIDNEGTKFAPDQIRQSFYRLFPGNWSLNLVDLGNLIETESPLKSLELLRIVLAQLPKDASVVILGGSQDLSLAVTDFLDSGNNIYNLSVIDAIIDSSLSDIEIDNENYLQVLLHKETANFQYLNVMGVQTYYNHPAKFKIFDQLYIDYYKLGEMQNQILDFEPELRQANFVSIDARSIKYSDMPAHKEGRPNGFNGIDICRLSRLAGVGTQNRFFGIFEYNPLWDKANTGSQLMAQILWYYIEGKNRYQPDYPNIRWSEMIKFHVEHKLFNLIFYKNPNTNRWWFKLPEMTNEILFPCNEKDYQQAISGQITPRIYKFIEKNSL